MAWSFSVYSAVILASAVVALVVAAGALRNRPDPMAWPLALLMGTAAAWAIPHAVSLGFADVELVAFWHQMRYPGTVFAPIVYLVVALKYAGHDQWLSRRVYALLSVVPLFTLALVWTNSYHGLFWESLAVVTVNGASVLEPEFGPWYWLNLGFLYLVTITSLSILGGVVLRSGPIYRKQATLMFVGGLVPLATNVAINFGFGPAPMVDFTTTSLVFSGVTFALALFHFDLLEIRPVARDLLIKELDDGVIVVGPDNRIRDYNPTAAKILDGIEIDDPAEEALLGGAVTDGGKYIATVDGRERQYQIRHTPLTDKQGRKTGEIIYLNEVTDIIEREQRISVLNRILRHNIRNELNVVSGQLEILEERVSTEHLDHVETANEHAQRIIEFANKARNIEQTLQHSDMSVAVPVASAVADAVADVRDTYPDATVRYDTPRDTDIAIRAVDGGLFEMAVVELLDNAITHCVGDPHVVVSIEADSGGVHVSVADNCPPIPKEEKAILNSHAETDLQHGTGLGLWLVKWTVSMSSGDLSFGERDDGGNVVTLTFPAAD